MAAATVLDLVDRGYSRREVCNFMNLMWCAMAVITACLTTMNAAADTASNTGVALATAIFVRQWLEVGTFVLGRNIGVALLAGDVRMCGRREGHIFVAFTTIDVLRDR